MKRGFDYAGQRQLSCVLDVSLVFSGYGLLLVQLLGKVLELWVARELWHMLENPSSYLARQNRMDKLHDWAIARANTLPADLNLFWIGDRPADSFMPLGSNPHLIPHWEALARSLDQRLQEKSAMSDLMAPSFRDTAALAAVLGSAFILTCQPASAPDNISEPPEICQVLTQWGIPCQEINPLDAIATIERQNLLQLMVSAGFSKYLWTDLNLAVLHLCVPSEKGWENASGYWYPLHTGTSSSN